MKLAASGIHVLTLADASYAMPLAVTVRSLLENHQSDRLLTITIVDGGISKPDRAKLESSWNGASTGRSHWQFVAPSYGNADNLPVWGRVPALTYARLDLNAYYTNDQAKTVVLDSDTLVLTDIAALFDTDLTGRTVAACIDPFIPSVSAIDGLARWRDLRLSADAPYLNAGIMAVDLHRWRDLRICARAIEYISDNLRQLRQYDQDALNAVLINDWTVLDPRWHVHPRTPNALGATLPADPRIFHFSGRLKPWLYQARHEADDLFFDYLSRTEWRNKKPPTNPRAIFYRLYDSGLRRLLYPLEIRAAALTRTLQQR